MCDLQQHVSRGSELGAGRCGTLCSLIAAKILAGITSRRQMCVPATAAIVHGKCLIHMTSDNMIECIG